MTSPLWQKDDTVINEAVMAYMAGQDISLDAELLPFDIRASIAHVRGLMRIGCLSPTDGESLVEALQGLAAAFKQGQFSLDSRFEDGHSAIEAYLVEELGELGKRVHLGRSRNDQVLVATRLYQLDALARLKAQVHAAAVSALNVAESYQDTVMPGYTHLQRAVPSTIGLWMASFAESFLDDVELIQQTRQWISASPLGTAAGYGVNLPLDRDGVAQELEFARVQINPMYAQASRGKFDLQVLMACWQVMQDLRRLAWDFSLFSMAEFGFVMLPSETTTGSSIMPNKKNPDLVELLRGGCAVVSGCLSELQGLLSLPSGYHRDLQLSKEPMLRGLRVTLDSIAFVPLLLDSVEFDHSRMADAIDGSMLATDRATDLAQRGMTFRDAYQEVARTLDQLSASDASNSIRRRTSPGACADLRLHVLRDRLASCMADAR